MNENRPASFRTVLPGLAGILIVSFIGFAVYELRAAWTGSAAMAELRRQHTADEGRLRQLDQTEQSVVAQAAQAEKKLTAAPAPGAPSAADDQLKAARKAARANGRAFFEKYPQARGLFVAYMSENMRNFYASFFRTAGLSQAQIDAFVAQTVQQRIDTLQMNPDGTWKVGKNNLSTGAVQSLLGEAASQQWQNAVLTMPAEAWVTGLALGVKNGTPPLTADQITQVTQAVAANSPEYASGKAVNLQSVDWAGAAEQAQTLMTDAQWQQAQNYLTLQAANRKLQALMKGSP